MFGVKLNYIVIFEKSCNSSTLLMELFIICGHIRSTNFQRVKLKIALLFMFYYKLWLNIKQANSLLQPTLKFVRDRNTRYNAMRLRT